MEEKKAVPLNNEKIGVVGSGLIGRSWAMLFAASGYDVFIYDIEPKMVQDALDNILVQLKDLSDKGLLRGTLTVEQQHKQIRGTTDLQTCVSGAKYVQECVPENKEVKTDVFKKMDMFVDEKTIMASSSSSMPPSIFSSEIKHREQCIVVHPTNPPFYCPLTEVCPAPYTRPDVTAGAKAIIEEIGQVPVMLKKEVFGFVLNRLQFQLLHECWRLVIDDVISPTDLDKVMSDGLGLRYAFVGPLETCHLNGQGFLDYCNRFGDMIYKVCDEFGPVVKMGGEAADTIFNALSEDAPVDKLVDKWRWRDSRLSALAKLKKDLKE